MTNGPEWPPEGDETTRGRNGRNTGLLDPDDYKEVHPRPAPPDPETGGEVIDFAGLRARQPEPEDLPPLEGDDIVESDEGDVALTPPAPGMLQGAIEALLLAADGPVSLSQLNTWLAEPGEGVVRDALREVAAELARGQRGWRLVEVAKGWQLRTDIRYGRWVARMRGGRPQRLSPAAMDVLAVLAYRQPCTRAEIDQLRGVDSGGVLRLLCERGLAAVMGRKDVPGRPLLYGTTKNFLSLFGLRDLSDLPTLRDLRELRRDDDRLPPGAAELLGISAEQLGRALGLEPEDITDEENDDEHEPVQTSLFAVVDPNGALDDEDPT